MTIETDLNVMEHAGRTWRFTLKNESGEVLPLDAYVIYGAAECPGQALRAFTVEVKGGVATVRMPGLPVGDWPWKYQIFVLEVSSRVEWLLCCGSVNVLGRVAGGHVALSPEQLEFTGVLDRVTQQASIVVGENMVSIAENARHAAQAALDSQIARDGALAARSGAEGARDGALAARGDAEAARDDAVLAKDGAQVAQGFAEAARDGAQAAKDDAVLAKDGAQVAQAGAETAREGAQVAQAGAETAREGAQVAQAGAETEREGAQAAKDDAVLAKDGAEAARDGAQDAKDDAVLAKAGAEMARDGAQVAQAGAEAAQVAAEDAAGVAAGAADAVRYDFLPITLEWLGGRLEKMYGAGMCSLALAEDEGSLRVAFSLDMGAPQVEEAGALLERILPRNLVTEMYWDDGFPVNYTRLEYLESSGSQWMITDFVPNNESGVMARYINNSGNSVHPIVTKETVDGNKRGFSVATMRSVSSTTCVWGTQRDPAQHGPSTTAIIEGQTNYRNARTIIWSDRETKYSLKRFIKTDAVYPDYPSPLPYTPTVPFHFCKDLWYGSNVNFKGKLLEAKFSQGEQDVCIFVPALDDTGVPCMYDLLARKACYNSGSGHFIAGVETMEQLDAVLRGLPDYTGQDGGELHLRLSDTLYEAAVTSGIIEAAATSKNWQIAYDPTTEIAA